MLKYDRTRVLEIIADIFLRALITCAILNLFHSFTFSRFWYLLAVVYMLRFRFPYPCNKD